MRGSRFLKLDHVRQEDTRGGPMWKNRRQQQLEDMAGVTEALWSIVGIFYLLKQRRIAVALRAIRRTPNAPPAAVLCVELIALTAVRAGEARGARWEEIDLDSGTWTIPAARMKSAREFTVPLSTGALDVLGRAGTLSAESPFVFPSKTGGPLPTGAPARVLRRAAVDSTLHGFRSSARSWMAESGIPAEVAEACLAGRGKMGSGVGHLCGRAAPYKGGWVVHERGFFA